MAIADEVQTSKCSDFLTVEGRGLLPSPHVDVPLKKKDSLGFDKVKAGKLFKRWI